MQNERFCAPQQAASTDDDQPPRALPPPERIQELLFDAARLGRIDVIPALIQAGGNIAKLDPGGYTPLILACYHNHQAAAALLLEYGAPVDQGDAGRGNTALMGVTFKGLAAIAEHLLAADADPNATNHAGQTALMFAALFARGAIADLLIARGADPSLVDAAGNNAVSVARAQGNELMAKRLTARRRVHA